MKWNIEWVDLQNIERMTAECWRLSEKQLQQYCEQLSQQRDLIFAGELGITFLELMEGLSVKQAGGIWSDIQKDVHMIQKMIQQGMAQDKHHWIRLYHDLSDQPEFYFYTQLGKTFISLIAVKLEIDLPEEQKFLHHDIQKIQEICDTCDFQDVAMVKETLASLKEQEDMLFLSWLGVDFLHIIEQRFGEKKEVLPIPEIETKNMHRGLFHKKNPEHISENSNKTDVGDLDFLNDLESLSEFSEISDQDILSDQEAILNEELPVMPTEQKKADRVKKKKAPGVAKIICTVIICIVMCILGVYLIVQIHKRELAKKAAESLKKQNTGQISEDNSNASNVEVRPQKMQVAGGQIVEIKNQSENMKQKNTESGEDVDAGRNVDKSVDADTDVNEDSGKNSDSNRSTNTETKTDTGKNKDTDRNPVTGTDKGSTSDLPDILPKYQNFHSQYPNLFGWLTIPNTEIDHPIMQAAKDMGGEPYFYLHHDYQGNATEEGSLFVDSESSCYPQDHNTVIYGHNMKDGRNFGMLERFEDRTFCESHRTIYYDTIYQTGTYQVVAVLKSRVLYQEEEGFRYYQLFNYQTREIFQECVDFIRENQIYDLGVSLHYGDRLLMLSTCDYSRENGRLVVVAVKV